MFFQIFCTFLILGTGIIARDVPISNLVTVAIQDIFPNEEISNIDRSTGNFINYITNNNTTGNKTIKKKKQDVQLQLTQEVYLIHNHYLLFLVQKNFLILSQQMALFV